MLTPSRSLRRRLATQSAVVAAGAHDSLSARLVEQAGFDAVWASGFGLSAVRAVPDASIITMTETLEASRAMARTVSIPVIADCDNGFGNAINVMRTVADFEAAGVAAICIEDNIFPKRCSFYAGVRRELVPADEHARKVAAAKAAQSDPEFVVIARTEALIAGWGKQEALTRARAYADAGADAILVHSKERDARELAEFAREWDRAIPLVSVPTTYVGTPVGELRRLGFQVVIYANQALRASVRAMRDELAALHAGQTLEVEGRVASLEQVYELVGVPELEANESRFLVPGGEACTAIILAAGDDGAMGELTVERPKCMLDIKGRTILDRQIGALNAVGVKDIAVVRGYRKEAIDLPHLRLYDNDRFADTGELASLWAAESELRGPVVCLYGDVIFDETILGRLLRTPADVAIAVDRAFPELHRAGRAPRRPLDLVITDEAPRDGHRFVPSSAGARVQRIGVGLDPATAHGEFAGLLMLSERGAALVRDLVAELRRAHRGRFHEAESLDRAQITDLLQELIDRGHEVVSVDLYKGWMEIDTFEDYRRAWAEIRS